jgi:hypothetical protein
VSELKIKYTTDERNVLTGYYADGHCDMDKFYEQIEDAGEAHVNRKAVRHLYGKVTGTLAGDKILTLSKRRKRGSFPITYVTV